MLERRQLLSVDSVENVWAAPSARGFVEIRRLISLLQRIRPRRPSPGQDGDARAPVLINSSASCAVFNTRLPERRLTVRPSRLHPPANPACTTGAFAPTERTSTRPRIPLWRQTVSRAAAPPRRSSPACWPRRRPRHCDGPSSSALSPIGRATCHAPRYGAARRAPRGSIVCANTFAALADSEQLRLTPGSELPRNQAQPCGEIATVVEALRLTDSGNERRCDNRAEARDRRQPTGLFVLLRPANELSIKGCDPSIELRPLRAGVLDEQDHAWAQSRSAPLIHQHGQELLELPLALRRDHSSLQQNGAQLIDQSCPLPDQPVSRSMKCLHVELVLALQFDKAHRRPGRRLRDPLGVAIVVLLRLDVGPDIFGRHQADIVAVGGEHAAEMMSPEFWGEVQPLASLKGLDIPPRRAVFVPWKPSRRPAFGMG